MNYMALVLFHDHVRSWIPSFVSKVPYDSA
jgi:hypothetical protein